MGNRIDVRNDDAILLDDAGVRARRLVGVVNRRRLARRIVERGQCARKWIRALVLCKAALLAAVLMIE